MAKMVTVSAKVSVEDKMKFQRLARENNLTISALIKQVIETGNIINVNKVESLRIEKLEEMNRISNDIHDIKESCDTDKPIGREVLLALIRVECAIKNF